MYIYIYIHIYIYTYIYIYILSSSSRSKGQLQGTSPFVGPYFDACHFLFGFPGFARAGKKRTGVPAAPMASWGEGTCLQKLQQDTGLPGPPNGGGGEHERTPKWWFASKWGGAGERTPKWWFAWWFPFEICLLPRNLLLRFSGLDEDIDTSNYQRLLARMRHAVLCLL